jgi:predicted transcriptional regulator
MDFACKKIDIEEVMKCSLGVTKAELLIMKTIMKQNEELDTQKIAQKTNLDLTTVQKAVKKLHEKGILIKDQKNLGSGGYIFLYKSNSREKIRSKIKEIVGNWFKEVEKEIEKI